MQLHDPIAAAIEADARSLGGTGLLNWLMQYYGAKPGVPAPLFMAADKADPLDLLHVYSSDFESSTRELLTEAAHLSIVHCESDHQHMGPLEFFVASRLAEIVSNDLFWDRLARPFETRPFPTPSTTYEKIALREAFEAFFRAIDTRAEDLRLVSRAASSHRTHFEPFNVVCRAAIVELATPHDTMIAAHAPLFFLAVAYDIIFATFDEATVIQRGEARLSTMASLFDKEVAPGLPRYASAMSKGLGPYDLDAIRRTWFNFIAVAFNKPLTNTDDPPPIDSSPQPLTVSTAGYYSKINGPAVLRARQLENEAA